MKELVDKWLENPKPMTLEARTMLSDWLSFACGAFCVVTVIERSAILLGLFMFVWWIRCFIRSEIRQELSKYDD